MIQLPKWPVSTERELELLREVLESGRWGAYHDFVARLESQFATFHGCRYGIAAANGTVTLEMALEAADIRKGDEVIVPSISFISTATAVSRVGAVPVFVDIEPYTFNLDPERVASAISGKTKAILAVHFGGPLADMDRLMEIAGHYGIPLLEDAAHAHGSAWRGRRAGSFGLAGSFSFQNSKVMTAGEGGMLVSNNEEFAFRARSIGDQGRQPDGGWFHHYTLGTNYRMTALQAAVLLAQLERLPEQIAVRTRNAAILREELSALPGLTLQQVPPEVTANSWYLLLGRIDATMAHFSRDDFHARMREKGIPCTPFYPHPLYGNPLYRNAPCRVEPCPIAEACIADAFWLPHRVLMGSEETTRAITAAVRGLWPPPPANV